MKSNPERFIKNKKPDTSKSKNSQIYLYKKFRLITPTKCRCNFSWLRFWEVFFVFSLIPCLNIEFWYFYFTFMNNSSTKKLIFLVYKDQRRTWTKFCSSKRASKSLNFAQSLRIFCNYLYPIPFWHFECQILNFQIVRSTKWRNFQFWQRVVLYFKTVTVL